MKETGVFSDDELKAINTLVDTFRNGKTVGSLIKVKPLDYTSIESAIGKMEQNVVTTVFNYQFFSEGAALLKKLLAQAKVMTGKYDVMITNPPYLGISKMESVPKEYLISNYPNSKFDMFAMFLETSFTKPNGFRAIVCPDSWMFLATYEKMRQMILRNKTIITLVHLGLGAFDATVATASFVLREVPIPGNGVFYRLVDSKNKEADYHNVTSIIQANASMVFVGNVNQSVDYLLKTSHLFEPFPDAMIDSAFFDRMHCYIPGWEIPKMRPEYFTDNYGFISDYFAEFMREMRKVPQTDSFDKYFKLGRCLNQRDTIAVRKMVSGLTKLLYPDGKYTEGEIEEILKYAIEGRRRVKEQLKKIGGMEFYDVQFSYIRLSNMEEVFVPVLEQGGGKLIPEGIGKPGHVYTVANGTNGMMGLFKFETTMTEGSGKFDVTGLQSAKETKESVKTAQNYFRANAKQISASIAVDSKDYLMHIQDCQGVGLDSNISLAAMTAYCSCALERPVQPQMCVLGSMSIGGTINKVEELASTLQVAFDAGAKRILIPMSSAADIATVPADLFAKFQISFYSSPEDAIVKALGIE